jgi:hypothetical protein
MKIALVLWALIFLSGCIHLGVAGLIVESAKVWEIKKLKQRISTLEKASD